MIPSSYVLIHRLFRRLQQRNRFVGRTQLTGLTPAETHFLLELDADSNRSITDLSALLGIDQSFGSRISRELIKRRLLRAEPCLSDSRRKQLSITPEGSRVIRTIDTVANGLFEELTAAMSSAERDDLVDLFRLIADGYGHPRGIQRGTETPYRCEQRRITRCFGLLGEHVFESGLSASSWQLLSEVVLCPVHPQPTELATLLSLAQNSITSVIEGMEAEKLVRRVPREGDKRSVYIEPLPGGIKLYRSIESRAEVRLKDALKALKPVRVTRYLNVFQKFIGDMDTTSPPPPEGSAIVLLDTDEDRATARGLIARTMVIREMENRIPEVLCSRREKVFGFYREKQLLAAVSVAPRTTSFIAAGWKSEISPWVLFSILGQVALRLSLHTRTPLTESIAFEPVREYLGLHTKRSR